ncbi:MAG: hypothetical protein K2J32_06775 [Ruminococcus sp.]|nr:hypothetical protein [Ruminococcus sp.]
MRDFYLKWLNGEIKENIVLCCSSALRFLYWQSTELWIESADEYEYRIDVYALKQGQYDDVSYHVVDSFDDIDIETLGNLHFTSFEQSVNDLLRKSADSGIRDYEESVLMLSLSAYYIQHRNGFGNLNIRQENTAEFEKVKTVVLQKMQDIEELINAEYTDDTEELLEQVKCETCLYANQCDGYEYAPYCMAEIYSYPI